MTENKITLEEIEKRKQRILDPRYKGEYETALDEIGYLIRDFMFSDNLVVRKAIGWAMHERGVTFQNIKTNWKAAMECLYDAFAYRKAIDDIVGQAYTIFQIPMCRLARGDKKEDVLPDFQRAKPYILAVMKENIFTTEIMGNMYQNLAYIYQQEDGIIIMYPYTGQPYLVDMVQ